jgi:hypothetical protein
MTIKKIRIVTLDAKKRAKSANATCGCEIDPGCNSYNCKGCGVQCPCNPDKPEKPNPKGDKKGHQTFFKVAQKIVQ